VSVKKKYINALNASLSVTKKVNKAEESEFLTYVTANGIVCGEAMEYKELDFSTEDSTAESLSESIREQGGVDAFSIANAYFYKVNSEDENIDNPSIPLTNVQIRLSNGSIITTDHYLLFADQIIGIFPGKMDLTKLK
jgi:predicted Mrr-cat superfamily restriction endonuclease